MIHCVSINSPICCDVHVNKIWRSRFWKEFFVKRSSTQIFEWANKNTRWENCVIWILLIVLSKNKTTRILNQQANSNTQHKTVIGVFSFEYFCYYYQNNFYLPFSPSSTLLWEPKKREAFFALIVVTANQKSIQEPRLAEPWTSFTKDFFLNSVVEFIIFQYWFVTYMCTYVCAVGSSFFHHCCNLMIQNWCDRDISLTSPLPFQPQ